MTSQNNINNHVLNNDFLIQRTTASSGNTVRLLIQQTSNSASADATLFLEVGGPSGGDALVTYTVTGGQSWSTGVDNSDSDAYVISPATSLGGTNVARLDFNGMVNFPLQPAFFAYLSSTSTNQTGNGAVATVVCNTELFDINADYNAGTGVFTAPVNGIYLLQFYVTLTGCTICTNIRATLDVAGVAYIGDNYRTASALDIASRAVAMVSMTAGQTVTTKVTAQGEAADTDDILGGASPYATYFNGYLLG